MGAMQGYPTGTPAPGDYVLYTEDPTGTPVAKNALVSALGTGWTQVVDEDGSSLANWTTITGTWAVAGGVIECQSAGAGQDLRLDTPTFDGSDWVLEAEFQIADLAGYVGPGACYRSGTDITGTLELNFHAGTVIAVGHNVAAVSDIPATLVVDTWTALNVHFVGSAASIWLDGTPIGTVAMTDVPAGNQLMLRSYGAMSKWRNIKVWEATGLPF